MPYWHWFAAPEEIEHYESGKLPDLACPLGTYRDFNLCHVLLGDMDQVFI